MKLCQVKLVMSHKPISCYCVLFNDIVSVCTIGMGEEVISVAIYSTAARLGYASLKPCQESAVKAIHFRKRYFRITSNGMREILLLLLSSLGI